MVADGQYRLAPGGDRSESCRKVDFLKRAGTQYLCIYLTGEGQHRSSIDLCVPQTGQEVCCPRASDRKTCSGFAAQFCVSRAGERGGSLVPDSYILQLTCGRLLSDSFRNAKVGMSHHAEYRCYTPIHHRLDHQVTDCDSDLIIRHRAHIDAVFANLNRIRGYVVMAALDCLSGGWIKTPTVPGAAKQSGFDRSLVQRSTLVWTLGIQRAVFSVVERQGDSLAVHRDRANLPFTHFIQFGDAGPTIRIRSFFFRFGRRLCGINRPVRFVAKVDVPVCSIAEGFVL